MILFISKLDRGVKEWHYCKTGAADEFVALFFVDDKMLAKIFYLSNAVYGPCEKFVKTGNYTTPTEVQAILDK